MGRCHTVLLDLDGTLLDTLEDLTDSLNRTLRLAECPECTVEDTRRYLGNGLRRLLALALPEGEAHPRFDQLFAEFRPYYVAHCMEKTRPYPGIPALLGELRQRGYRLAVVTNKPEAAARALVEHYFDLPVVGQREDLRRKPEPDMVDEALRLLGSSREETVCVGDSEVDFEMGGRAGIPCILVSWGFRARKELAELHPAALVDRPQEILEILEAL